MKIGKVVLSLALALALVSAAQAQTNVRVRGTITALDGNELSVKSRDGRQLKVRLADKVTIAVARSLSFENLQKGHFVGVTTKPGPGGTLRAIEVHYVPPSVPEGHIPWDLQPGSMMTNATIEAAVETASKRELTLRLKDGTKKILVPAGIPIVRTVPGARADLKVGEYVFILAQSAADGTLSAPSVQVSKNGVKPPQ